MTTPVNTSFVGHRQYGEFKEWSKCAIALLFSVFRRVAKLTCYSDTKCCK